MKIQIASDLMPDRERDFCPTIDRDILVLAGDIGVGMSAQHFIEREVQVSPVIYVIHREGVEVVVERAPA